MAEWGLRSRYAPRPSNEVDPRPAAQGRTTRCESGNYLETAAAAAGVDKWTLHHWLRRGSRESSGPYAEFSHSVEKAMAKAEARDVARLDEAAQKHWQVSAWRLERRSPRRWGVRIQAALESELSEGLARLERFLRPDEYERVLSILAGELPPPLRLTVRGEEGDAIEVV